MNNRKVYLISLFLILLAGALVSAKIIHGGHSVEHSYSPHLWRISVIMNLSGQGTRAKVRLTLPRENPRQTIYNEHFENGEMVFYIRERAITGNRIGFWRSELLDGFKSIQYTFSAQLRSQSYVIPQELQLPKDPLKAYPADLVHPMTLLSSEFIQSDLLKPHLKKVIGREKKVYKVVQKIYDYIRGNVEYRSEKGSKDARATLDKLTADCGGQARLFVALSRAAGIPSRIVGGIITAGGVKNTTHVWAENFIGGQWIPFDVVNDYYATLPAHYLELYRGDYSLIKHTGLKKLEYFFIVGEEKMPPLDNPWSLYILPTHFQAMVKVLLQIPVGAFVVAFCRTIIGIQTFGTFTPILLSLALRQVSLEVGLLCLGSVIFVGWLLRKVLDHLKILVIPRLSIVLTMVVIMVLVMMILGFHFGYQQVLNISLFPMVIMTWMIERFSVLEIEDGTKNALKTLLGSTVVSIVTYYILGITVIRTYLFAFPELLFVIMAFLLILGRYTGIRIVELWRFKELKKNLGEAR